MTHVKTNLTVGSTRLHKFGNNLKHAISMHFNPKFEKDYDTIEDFLKAFYPTKPSATLMSRISEEFNKSNGRITFKPNGYQANQVFHFTNS